MRGVWTSLIWNAVLPVLLYRYLSKSLGWHEVSALIAASMFPVLGAIYSLVRLRVFDFMSGITLGGIVVSVSAVLLGGDQKLMLIRESFFTLLLGVGCFVSLFAWRRPLMFYFARYFECGNDVAKRLEFDQDYQNYALARKVHRLLTIVWGLAFLGEFLSKVVMVYSFSVEVVLGVGPVISNGIQVATIVWTLAYVRSVRSRALAEAQESSQEVGQVKATGA
jgi:hypothetical protein